MLQCREKRIQWNKEKKFPNRYLYLFFEFMFAHKQFKEREFWDSIYGRFLVMTQEIDNDQFAVSRTSLDRAPRDRQLW